MCVMLHLAGHQDHATQHAPAHPAGTATNDELLGILERRYPPGSPDHEDKWTPVPHKFDPAHRERLEHPDRLRLLPPHDLLIRTGLWEGMIAADVGCGPGFFTLPAAQIVGPAGRVYAIDISREMLEAVQDKARDAGLPNIETVLAKESGIPLPDRVAQVILLAFVLHEADDPAAFAREAARILAPGGHILLLEWKKEEMPVGPPVGDRLTPEGAEGWLTSAGLRIVDRFEPNTYHYALIGQASPSPRTERV